MGQKSLELGLAGNIESGLNRKLSKPTIGPEGPVECLVRHFEMTEGILEKAIFVTTCVTLGAHLSLH